MGSWLVFVVGDGRIDLVMACLEGGLGGQYAIENINDLLSWSWVCAK